MSQRFSKFKEFEQGRSITPKKIEYLPSGAHNSLYPDSKGGVWRFTFIDHDMGDTERYYETQYESFKASATGKRINQRYRVSVSKGPDNRWHWKWENE